MRGIAIVMVLIAHTGLQPLFRMGDAQTNVQWEPLLRVFQLGVHGVDIFFVLSGFLISSVLFAELKKHQSIDLRRFWLRRGLKIWPSYYAVYLSAALISSGILFLRSGGDAVIGYWQQAWPNLFFLQNYIHFDQRWFASWSLAIEEHFYLALPLTLLLLWRQQRKQGWVPWLCLFGIVVCAVWRWHAAGNGDFKFIAKQTHFRFDALFAGVMLGWVYAYQTQVWARLLQWRHTFLVCAVAFFIILYLKLSDPIFVSSVGYLLTWLAGAGLLIYFASRSNEDISSTWGLATLRYLGVHSYTIYLVQVLALHAYQLDSVSAGSALQYWPLGALGFWVVAIGGGVVCHHVVEQPVLAWRNRHLVARNARLKLAVPRYG